MADRDASRSRLDRQRHIRGPGYYRCHPAGLRVVEAGPEQAATWRQYGDWSFWKGALPNLMFPTDHSWLVSTLWDDDWTCIGGPAGLVDRFLRHPGLQARPVTLGEDATPPGHRAF